MKKILSFALLFSSFVMLNAQTQIGFVCNGRTYQNGDSIVVVLDNDHSTNAISFHNNTASRLQNLVATVTEVEIHGIEIFALCTEQCVPGYVSVPFNMPPSGDYPFSIDYEMDESVDAPYCIYNLEVSNGSITSTVTIRLQTSQLSIENVVENHLSAYPNPAQGQVSISYEVAYPSTMAIYDVHGRQVRQLSVSGSGIAVVSDLPTGVYTYGIVNGKNRGQMQKLIVK